jgi:hypothetical protein
MTELVVRDTARRFRFVAAFAVCRGLQYASPLVAVSCLTLADFGVIEGAFGRGTMISALLLLGTPNLLPAIVLSDGTRGDTGAVHSWVLLMAALCLALATAGLIGDGFSSSLTATFALGGVVSLQAYWSARLRAQDATVRAMVVDASPYGALAVTALCFSVASATPPRARTLVAVLVVLGIAALLQSAWGPMPTGVRTRTGRLWPTLQASVPLMLAGLLTLVVTTVPRFVLEGIAGPRENGAYVLLSRVAILPMVAHQAIVAERLPELFRGQASANSRLASTTILLVGIGALAMAFTLPYLPWLAGSPYLLARTEQRRVAVLLSALPVLWSAVALHDLVSARAGIAGRTLLPAILGAVLGAIPGLLATLLGLWDIVSAFALAHIGALAGQCIGQALALLRAREYLHEFWMATVVMVSMVLTAACIAS